MRKINFIKLIPLFLAISLVALGISLFSLVRWGMRPAVDFVGGSLAQVMIKAESDSVEGGEVSEGDIRESLAAAEVEAHLVQSAQDDQWIIRTKLTGEDLERRMKDGLTASFGEVEVVRFESVGPTLGKELLGKTIFAVVIAAGGILVYVTWRFRGGKYGICANLAMLHDSLILIGSFSLLGYFYGIEVDTLFVTAVLTILSFSVHDTIVVYDRIRENLRRHPREGFEKVVNWSINETLGRSINNSLTIIFMLLALAILGGETIKSFALALLIGTITGTYSSTFTAAPLLVLWERFSKRQTRSKKR